MKELNGLTIVSNYIIEGLVLIELSDGSILYIDADTRYSYGETYLEWEHKTISESDLDDYHKLCLGKITREEYNKIQSDLRELYRKEQAERNKQRELQQLEVLQAKYNLSK